MKTKQNEPAFPALSQMNESGYISNENFGMSKRFYAACAAIQGMLANKVICENLAKQAIDNKKISLSDIDRYVKIEITAMSYQYADELLSQENE